VRLSKVFFDAVAQDINVPLLVVPARTKNTGYG
jgi:hypothetical protein